MANNCISTGDNAAQVSVNSMDDQPQMIDFIGHASINAVKWSYRMVDK